MATDALQVFQALVTKTSTFRGTAFSLPGGTPRRGNTCRVIYSAASNASGANTVIFSVDVSKDAGSTWTSEFQSDPILLTTVAKSGEIFIPYRCEPNVMATSPVVPQVALSVNITGAGSTPTITYQGDASTGGPA